MPVSNDLKAAVLQRLQKSNPLMDVEAIKAEFLEWLADLKCPGSTPSSWAQHMKILPTTPEEINQTWGRKVRLALSLRTKSSRYVVMISETLDVPSRGVYVLALVSDWRQAERRKAQSLEEHYLGSFDDRLRAKHTLWAQTFRVGELKEALNCCAVAILGNELSEKQEPEFEAEPLERHVPNVPHFPAKNSE